MPPNLGVATLRTSLDRSGLTRGLTEAKGETTRTLNTIDRRFEQTGQKFTQLGQRMSLGVTAPILALGAASIKAASDAEETLSKFGVVFRDIGDQAEQAAERLERNFGLSSVAARQLLADTGDLLTGFGFTQESALDLSQQVNELAVDLASFTNFSGGAEGASDALTKALLGEREAVKALGIAILEEDVQAQVLLNTQKGLTFETERQAEAYATLQIAQRQSANAQGDFARTSDSFSNQLRILRGNTNDLAVALGTGLLPIVTPLISNLADAAEGFAEMNEAQRTAILVAGGVAAATGPVLIGLGGIVTLAPKVVTGFNTMRTAAIKFRTTSTTLFGPAGVVLLGVTALAALSAQIIKSTNALNEYANKGIQVAGLSTQAAQVMEAIMLREERKMEVFNQFVENGLEGEELRGAMQRYNAETERLRGRFEELVRSAKELETTTSNVPDANPNVTVNVEGLPELQEVERILTETPEQTTFTYNPVRQRSSGMAVLSPEERRAARQRRIAFRREQHNEEIGALQFRPREDPEALKDSFQRAFNEAYQGFVNEDLARGDGGLGEVLAEQARRERNALAIRRQNQRIFNEGVTPFRRRDDPEQLPRLVAEAVAAALREEFNNGLFQFADPNRGDGGIGILRRQQQVAFNNSVTPFRERSRDLGMGDGGVSDLAFNNAQFAFRPRGREIGSDGFFTGRSTEAAQLEEAARINRDLQIEAATHFLNTVKDAGTGFANAIQSFSEGDIGGGIGQLGGVAAGIASLIPGGAAFAPLIQAGAGLFGGLINLFTGGGNESEQEAQAAAEAARRSVPAVNINFTFDQVNNYQGGPAQPANEQAFRRMAGIAIEEFMNRTKIPQRLAALEGA